MKEIFKKIGTIAASVLITSGEIFKENIVTTAVVSLITGTIVTVINNVTGKENK